MKESKTLKKYRPAAFRPAKYNPEKATEKFRPLKFRPVLQIKKICKAE